MHSFTRHRLSNETGTSVGCHVLPVLCTPAPASSLNRHQPGKEAAWRTHKVAGSWRQALQKWCPYSHPRGGKCDNQLSCSDRILHSRPKQHMASWGPAFSQQVCGFQAFCITKWRQKPNWDQGIYSPSIKMESAQPPWGTVPSTSCLKHIGWMLPSNRRVKFKEQAKCSL